MDTTLDRIKVQLGTTEEESARTTQGLPPRPLQGGRPNNGFDMREVTCYRCGIKGHMSCDCPQQNWNRRGNSRRNSNFRGRGRGSQQQLNY
jgi:hypothetical protein